MKRNLSKRIILLGASLLLGASGEVLAQKGYWQPMSEALAAGKNVRPFAAGQQLFQADLPAIRAQLASVPKGKTAVLSLPLQDGQLRNFRVQEEAVLTPELAVLHPEIKTYSGVSVEDAGLRLRLTVSPSGVQAMVAGAAGLQYLQPLSSRQPEITVVYRAADVAATAGVQCGVTPSMEALMEQKTTLAVAGFDGQLRTYTISVAATGEYTSWAGGQAGALAAITATINNVNAIYERDLAIHLTLNSPNTILYTDSLTDPFTSSASPTGTTLNESHSAIAGAMGLGNFNLGHVFNAGWSGGLAQLQSLCDAAGKGRAASGLDPDLFSTGPSGPIFDATVAHEIGHQLGATHTFAANNGGCNGNVSGTTAWEPGGGSTIMAYAGTCTGNAYQNNSDLYFHAGSIGQMAAFVPGVVCGSANSTGNTVPVATITPDIYSIPHSTPFRLTLNATDADGDPLTYTWEQMNPQGGVGTSSAPSPTATTGPQFRSCPPSSSATRYLPSLSALVSGSVTYERLPTVARGMAFRGTARDNHPGAGAASAQDVTVNTLSCGPFGFTSQNSANTLNADGTNTMTLTWNTASACVTCNNVNVLFSTDGGATYPFTVLANTANDGTEIITVPNLPTCAGRFMIECSDNIFFNINAANQTITSACAANGTTIAPSATLSVAGAGDPSLNMSLTPLYGSPYANPITGNIETTDPASNLSLRNVATNTCASYSNPVHYDAYLFMPSVSGTYTFNAAGSSGGLVYNLYEGSYDASSPCANFLASSASVSGSATLTNTVSGNLCAQKTYVLLVTSFDAGTPALPASYTVNVSGPGTLYSGIAAPGGGISYSYVVVNNIGNVVSVSAAADMSNGAVYAAGDYRVYGISSSATAASLNTTYAGLPFTTLYNAALNQAGGLCASISTNYRRVVIGTALPAQLLAFRARLKDARTALIDWQASEEADLKQYTLERSFDGQAFAALHARKPLLTAAGTAAYHYADPTIPQGTAAVWYRLQMTDAANRSFSSEAIRLVPGMEQQAMMAIAPNPIKGGVVRAQITLPEAGHYLLTIVDVAGRVVRTESRSLPAGSSTCMVGLPDLPAGVYALRLAAEHCVLNARFVVQ